jgi:hypothetical protein
MVNMSNCLTDNTKIHNEVNAIFEPLRKKFLEFHLEREQALANLITSLAQRGKFNEILSLGDYSSSFNNDLTRLTSEMLEIEHMLRDVKDKTYRLEDFLKEQPVTTTDAYETARLNSEIAYLKDQGMTLKQIRKDSPWLAAFMDGGVKGWREYLNANS